MFLLCNAFVRIMTKLLLSSNNREDYCVNQNLYYIITPPPAGVADCESLGALRSAAHV